MRGRKLRPVRNDGFMRSERDAYFRRGVVLLGTCLPLLFTAICVNYPTYRINRKGSQCSIWWYPPWSKLKVNYWLRRSSAYHKNGKEPFEETKGFLQNNKKIQFVFFNVWWSLSAIFARPDRLWISGLSMKRIKQSKEWTSTVAYQLDNTHKINYKNRNFESYGHKVH